MNSPNANWKVRKKGRGKQRQGTESFDLGSCGLYVYTELLRHGKSVKDLARVYGCFVENLSNYSYQNYRKP